MCLGAALWMLRYDDCNYRPGHDRESPDEARITPGEVSHCYGWQPALGRSSQFIERVRKEKRKSSHSTGRFETLHKAENDSRCVQLGKSFKYLHIAWAIDCLAWHGYSLHSAGAER
jgi:hypothetical protein